MPTLLLIKALQRDSWPQRTSQNVPKTESNQHHWCQHPRLHAINCVPTGVDRRVLDQAIVNTLDSTPGEITLAFELASQPPCVARKDNNSALFCFNYFYFNQSVKLFSISNPKHLFILIEKFFFTVQKISFKNMFVNQPGKPGCKNMLKQ